MWFMGAAWIILGWLKDVSNFRALKLSNLEIFRALKAYSNNTNQMVMLLFDSKCIEVILSRQNRI
jgi:hypothetical protein